MERHGILRFLVFVIFFSSGAAALGGAVLCDDFIQYCRNQHLIKQAELSIHKLESLNAEYDALLEQLEGGNPDLMKRIAPVTLGTRIEDPNTVYPKARVRELAIARKTLGSGDKEPMEATIPVWLQRCSDPAKRIILFISGASLVLISMVCFTSGQDEDDEPVQAASTGSSSHS